MPLPGVLHSAAGPVPAWHEHRIYPARWHKPNVKKCVTRVREVQGVVARQHQGVGGGMWTGKCVEAGRRISRGRETWVGVRRGWCGLGHIGVGCGSWCVGGKVCGGRGVDRLGSGDTWVGVEVSVSQDASVWVEGRRWGPRHPPIQRVCPYVLALHPWNSCVHARVGVGYRNPIVWQWLSIAISNVLAYSTSPIDLSNLPTVLQNLSATIFPTLKPIAVNVWNNPQLSGSENFAHDQVVHKAFLCPW